MAPDCKNAREKSLTIGCPSGKSAKKRKIIKGYARPSHPDPRGWLFSFKDGPSIYLTASFGPGRRSRSCNPRSRQGVSAAPAVVPPGGTVALAETEIYHFWADTREEMEC